MARGTTHGAGQPVTRHSGVGAFLWRWGPSLAWIALVFWSTSVHEMGPVFEGGLDKWAHAFAYLVMALLFNRSFFARQVHPRLRPNGWIVFVSCALVGLAGELWQRWTPGRDFQPLDLLADMAGTVVALILLLPRYKQASFPGGR